MYISLNTNLHLQNEIVYCYFEIYLTYFVLIKVSKLKKLKWYVLYPPEVNVEIRRRMLIKLFILGNEM